MATERQTAGRLTKIIGLLVLLIFIALVVGLLRSCNSDREGLPSASPPEDQPGPDGAPGVEQTPDL